MWLVYVVTLLWGIGFTCVYPLTSYGVNPFLLQCLSGLFVFLINLIILCTSSIDWREEWQFVRNPWMMLALFGYVLCIGLGNILYLITMEVDQITVSLLTSITSCYFLVTVILSWIIFSDYENIYLPLAIPCLVIILICVIALGFASR